MRNLLFSALAVVAGIYAEKKFKVSDYFTGLICQSNNNDPEEEDIKDEEDFNAI